MFNSKNANLIVWVLSIWLALVEIAGGQEASGTDQADQVLQQAEPISGRILPRAVFIDLPQLIIHDQDPVFPAFDRSTAASINAPSEQQEQTLLEYRDLIERTETAGGAWSPSLVEQLAAIGNLQQIQGDHLAALRSFDRAMHVSRVNAGLNTVDQIPIVQNIINSHAALAQWAEVDLYQSYLFYIRQRIYGPNDPRIIPALQQLGEWNMQAFGIGLGDTLGLRLSAAQLLFNAAARLVEFHYGRSDARYIPYLRNVVHSAYQVARNPQLISELGKSEFRGDQAVLAAMINERLPSQPAGFIAGEQALRSIISVRQEQEDVYALAESIAELADWYLLYAQRRAADELYLSAWQLLADEENAEALQQSLFGSVVAIPLIITEPRMVDRRALGKGPESLTEGYVDLSFTVTRNGSVRRVSVLSDENAQNIIQLGSVGRALRSFVFRPVLQDGVPVATEDNRFRIRYWY
ncbi:MAG: hypothetical protein CBC67_00780 [Gammaproteobacteria bacterium TMED107]|nr:hypothetical protein [Gammaproteobacteria bacterium]OUX77458.1 MAG: hypothetical protein CBC67_00780 [Gammaproteobacteria bacterium TMED107]